MKPSGIGNLSLPPPEVLVTPCPLWTLPQGPHDSLRCLCQAYCSEASGDQGRSIYLPKMPQNSRDGWKLGGGEWGQRAPVFQALSREFDPGVSHTRAKCGPSTQDLSAPRKSSNTHQDEKCANTMTEEQLLLEHF